jgi:hypothetical protein
MILDEILPENRIVTDIICIKGRARIYEFYEERVRIDFFWNERLGNSSLEYQSLIHNITLQEERSKRYGEWTTGNIAKPNILEILWALQTNTREKIKCAYNL